MSLRLAGARHAGLDETMVAEVARHDESRLSDRRRAALQLADAFVTDPAGITGDLRGRVAQHLSAGEIVELMFDVIAWSQQKVLVALSLDAPVDPEALTSLDFDAVGHAVVGGSRL
jgi:alkylhydroperoxidase family enzyme